MVISSTNRISGFDGLRAIAFLIVFISHKAPTPFTDRYGMGGVWIFFVLSGFLITRILARSRERMEAASSTFRAELSSFYVRRTARIFPVYYAFLAGVTLLSLAGLIEAGEPARQASNWLYVSNLYIERWGWSTDLGHLWSLAVEEQFYLLFAPLALLLSRRRLPQLCIALIGLSVMTHAILLSRESWHVSFEVNSLVNFGLLAIGGLAGLVADRPLPGLLQGDLALAVTLATVFVAPALFVSADSWSHFGLISAALTALALIQIYQSQDGRITGLFGVFPLRELGVISYGAYLFHPVIKGGALLHLLGYEAEVRHSVGMMLDLFITVGLALVSWKLLERPVRNAAAAIFSNGSQSVSDPLPG